MFLKSIEIQGFKSFPDKVTMHFDRGVTAIVGPNGSGKSNIVDAIRWVLGEQSSKTLRGGKMEDVIFGGTLKRRPVSFCEVTLVLDNSAGKLPLGYSEVSVTRRYYRSGESEFYLNKKSVRLKDIHELFMDTGLGRDGYSIIGQGRIDEILSVKSADRREIFEEAAGITRFRYRKEESERRLKGCEENLLRVRDIIVELENQVGPLKAQAETAKSYLLLRDELRVLEVSMWMESLDKLKDNLQGAQTDFENAQRKLSSLKAGQEEMQEKLSGTSEVMYQLDAETERLREQLSAEQALENDMLSQVAVSRNTLRLNEENMAGKERELNAQADRGDGMAAQLEARRQQQQALSDQQLALERSLAELMERAQAAAGETRDLSDRLDAMSAAIQLKRQQAGDTQAELRALESTREETERRGGNAQAELEALETRLDQEQARAAQIKKSIEDNTDKKQSAENMLRGFSLRRESRQKKKDELDAALLRLRREKDAKADRVGLLSAMEREYEGFSGAVRRVMQAASRGELRGVHGPVADLIETDERYAVAIEIALGASMQNVVVDGEQDGKAAINYLKQKDLGRATFLPLSAVKDRFQSKKDLTGEPGFFGWADQLARHEASYSGLVQSLLGGTAVMDNLDSAIACAKRHSYSFRIVTLDGQLINPSGAMTGGSLNKNTGVLSRAGEIRRLREELSALEGQLEAQDKALREAARDLEAALYESEVAEGELRQAEDALLTLEAERHQHGALVETLKASIEGLQREKSGQSERLAQLSADIAALEGRLGATQAEIDALVGEQAQLQGGRLESEAAAGSLAGEAAQCRESMAALRAEQEAGVRAIAELEAMIASLSEERGTKQAAIEAMAAQNAQLLREIEAQEAKAGAHGARVEQLRQQIQGQGERKRELEGQRTKLEKDAQARMNDIINMERECSRLENKKTQAEMEEDNIIERLWEGYELTRVTARQVAAPIESPAKANRRISELKSGIKKLGDVNVSAIEEYAKVSERYEFLTGQRDDLEKAKSDLLRVIDELTENMKSIFAAEFEKINLMFQQTFVEIFGGGSGYLKLEDESDILNCGIEIKVELPGKAMRVISLLSGGEKAFVAIALYFAIIKVRPTPFCVLDEIDAALDNVNVVRFSDYLRTLSDFTQFIVITHRRGTMEGADILYGVTMQEKGVTKLLTLNISEVEKQISVKPS